MKTLFMILFFCSFVLTAIAQVGSVKTTDPDKYKKIIIVETAFGECWFGLPSKGCDLAIRLDGKSYFVDRTDIDSRGDANEKDGFCNVIRRAKIQGYIEGNRFNITYFQLLPEST